MNETMSTTKEKEVIWEENNSTQHQKKYELPQTNDVCDITTATNASKESVPSTDTIKTKVSGIYKIINKVNGKYYVGSSKCIKNRWSQHKADLRNNNHKNDYLQNAWNKYGENNFEFIIIEENISERELLIVEQRYLHIAHKEQKKCYNLNFDASGGNISEYSKQKISMFHKGKILSNETRRKISESTKKVMNTPEMFNKMSVIRKGKKLSELHKLKISEKSKLRKFSEETKRKLSMAKMGNKNPMFGKHMSPKSKQKLSNALCGRPSGMKGKHHSEYTKIKIGEDSEDFKKLSKKCEDLEDKIRKMEEDEADLKKMKKRMEDLEDENKKMKKRNEDADEDKRKNEEDRKKKDAEDYFKQNTVLAKIGVDSKVVNVWKDKFVADPEGVKSLIEAMPINKAGVDITKIVNKDENGNPIKPTCAISELAQLQNKRKEENAKL